MSAVSVEPGDSLHILLVEDDEDYAALVRSTLTRSRELTITVDWVGTLNAATEQLEETDYDAMLLDLHLPDERGLRTLQMIGDEGSRPAVVVLTALRDQQVAIESLRLGAQEYVVKDELSGELLTRVLRYAIERKRLQNELVAAQRAEERERELRKMERNSSRRSNATAEAFGNHDLHAVLGDRFEEMVGEYGRLLDLALDEQAFRMPPESADDLRHLASVLGYHRATPRDVVEIHTRVLRKKMHDATPMRAQAMAHEGRMLVLQLMGYLANYYRSHAIPGTSGPPPKPPSEASTS